MVFAVLFLPEFLVKGLDGQREKERERAEALGCFRPFYWGETRKIVKAAWFPINLPTNGYKKTTSTPTTKF